MTQEHTELITTPEFKAKVESFKRDFYDKYKRISREKTPDFDRTGKPIIKKRPDGKDYVDEAYMRDKLSKYFPGWSSVMASPLIFLGSEWVVAQVELQIIDEYLMPLGINPPIRKFYGTDSVRIQYKKNLPHTPENIVDVGDNCQSAVSGALKRAINRLTNICDDIYAKRIEDFTGEVPVNQTVDVALNVENDKRVFNKQLEKHRIRWSEAFEMLGIKSTSEIADYKKAWETIKEKKGIKEV